jgi:hypothetical protein
MVLQVRGVRRGSVMHQSLFSAADAEGSICSLPLR